MFSLCCVRVRPGRGLTSGCYGPWRMLGWLVKHLCLSKSLHPENSLSLCTPPGSGISPISPEKCVFFFLLFRVRAARKDESVQRRSAGKRESWAATEHTQIPAHFTAELPAALRAHLLTGSSRTLVPVRCKPTTGSPPKFRCFKLILLPRKGLQDPAIQEAEQGKPFLAREKKDLGGPLSSGDPPDPHCKQL